MVSDFERIRARCVAGERSGSLVPRRAAWATRSSTFARTASVPRVEQRQSQVASPAVHSNPLRTSSRCPPAEGAVAPRYLGRNNRSKAHEREHEATLQQDAAWVRPAVPRLPPGGALCYPADRAGLIGLLE
jgi:hypothetical protein